uniref:Uncharacterized protein n=1 Tax=Clytia hemisphaerica TaxID=252671 RepID=A0A7M5XMN5_9CNID
SKHVRFEDKAVTANWQREFNSARQLNVICLKEELRQSCVEIVAFTYQEEVTVRNQQGLSISEIGEMIDNIRPLRYYLKRFWYIYVIQIIMFIFHSTIGIMSLEH